MNKKILSSVKMNKHIGMTALFSAFMFVQFIVLRLGNQAGRGLLSDERQELVYCFLQVAVIPGFLAHALLQKLFKGGKSYAFAISVLTACCFFGTEIMLFSPENTAFFLAVTGITVFLLGFLGGAVYFSMARMLIFVRHPGICIGLGYAAAVALQYVLQLRQTVKPALAVLLVLSFSAMALIILQKNADSETPPQEKSDDVSRSRLIFAVVITLAMLIFTTYYNSYIHHLQISSGYTDYNVYSWPRLLMIPGMLLFCAIGDVRGGRFLPVSTLCAAVIALLNAVLIGKETYFLNMCLYYLAFSANVAYYHLTFLRLAPRTKHTAVWACAGRVIDSAVVILSFCVGFSALSSVAVLVIDIAALSVIIFLMAAGGDFNLFAPTRKQEAKTSVPAADPFPVIKERYGVTSSELRVLRELVQTDDKQDVIAARLNISVSTLRHHVTSIYKKTGVQTRSALCKPTASHQQNSSQIR